MIAYRIRRSDGSYLQRELIFTSVEFWWTKDINRARVWLRRKSANEALGAVQWRYNAEVIVCRIVEVKTEMCPQCGLSAHSGISCQSKLVYSQVDGEIIADLQEAIEASEES